MFCHFGKKIWTIFQHGHYPRISANIQPSALISSLYLNSAKQKISFRVDMVILPVCVERPWIEHVHIYQICKPSQEFSYLSLSRVVSVC